MFEESKLTASDAQPGDGFGSSAAISGETVIIGARWEDGGQGDPLPVTGAAYIYERNEGGYNNWGQVIKLDADDAGNLYNFGVSVAIEGDTVFVGAIKAPGEPPNQVPNVGAVYIFERNQGGLNNWGQVTKINAADAQADDNFGSSLGVDGDTLIIGAAWEDGGSGDTLPNSGAAYVFERNEGGPNNWGQVAKLTANDAQNFDLFGDSVAISGDTVIVGARSEDGGLGDPLISSGAAYIFERNQGGADNWGQITKLMASDAQSLDLFGGTVAIKEDIVAIGAWNEDGGAGNPISRAGAVYTFERNQGGPNDWGQVAKLSADDAQIGDVFGMGLAVSNNIVIAGAGYEDGGQGNPLYNSGAVYIFTRNQGGSNNWGQVDKITADDAQSEDLFGTSLAFGNNILVVNAIDEDGGPGDPIDDAGAAYVYTLEGPTDVGVRSFERPKSTNSHLLIGLVVLVVLFMMLSIKKSGFYPKA
ncbi:MAG: FG-GAP repeat protein [Candidatus Promineifilaceae bacterium]